MPFKTKLFTHLTLTFDYLIQISDYSMNKPLKLLICLIFLMITVDVNNILCTAWILAFILTITSAKPQKAHAIYIERGATYLNLRLLYGSLRQMVFKHLHKQHRKDFTMHKSFMV